MRGCGALGPRKGSGRCGIHIGADFFFWGGDHYRLWTPLFRGFGLKGTGVWFYSFEILLAKGSNCPVSLLLRGFLV